MCVCVCERESEYVSLCVYVNVCPSLCVRLVNVQCNHVLCMNAILAILRFLTFKFYTVSFYTHTPSAVGQLPQVVAGLVVAADEDGEHGGHLSDWEKWHEKGKRNLRSLRRICNAMHFI